MSGAVSAVTKVFKKITKSVVGKVVLAAAVSYFTAGLGASFLGATGLAGSLSPTLGTVLSHAISGAVAGGITSGLTGGNIGQGLMFGGFGGAVTGGVQSFLGNYTPGSFDPSQAGSATAPSTASNAAGTITAGPVAPSGMDEVASANFLAEEGGFGGNLQQAAAQAGTGPVGAPVPGPGMLSQAAQGGGGGAATISDAAADGILENAGILKTAAGGGFTQATNTGVWDSLKGFVKDNPAATIAGGGALMQGVGSGMLAKASADAEKENAERKIAADKERLAGISASHSGGSQGLLTPEGNTLNQTQRPKPAASQVGAGAWVYSPEARRIVWVPN